MKIPEPIFKVLNVIVELILKSPFHRVMSDSMMIINFKGRVSGREYSTPVRYLEVDGHIRATTSKDTKWWRNLRSNETVSIYAGGKLIPCTVTVLTDSDNKIRDILVHFLSVFPQDAVYQNIRLEADNTLNQTDLEISKKNAVIVDFSPIQAA